MLAEYEATVLSLIDEVKQIAIAKGIEIDRNITDKTFKKMKSLPYETTSSMHHDFKKLKTEIDSLTGYIVQAGQDLNIQTPVYNEVYNHLRNKSSCC